MFERMVQIGNAKLYLGDCLEVMPVLDLVEAVITDPPYGALLGHERNGGNPDQAEYECFEDTPEYVESVVIPAVTIIRQISKRSAITTGKACQFKYPQPDDMGVWWNSAATGRGKWGFQNVVTPIFYYGPRPPRVGMFPSSYAGARNVSGADVDHPCPKPLLFMKWLVETASLEHETVLDPFMGSGTTGVACLQMNRKFIGIEIEEKYFDIACQRIEKASLQGNLFRENGSAA